jgi:hypothetical protein
MPSAREIGQTDRTGCRARISKGERLMTLMRHWHVTLTLAGDPVEPLIVRAAMQRLSEQHQFLDSVSSTADSAEIQFWDEGENMLDVASLAMRVWNEHRESANLPRWEVVGLEVLEKSVRDSRTSVGQRA